MAHEQVRCTCGKGVLFVAVKVKEEGLLSYSTEDVSPCEYCGSTDLGSARAKRIGLKRRAADRN
ncbi:MAG: hypothetical protein Q8N23_27145 [Archangium sp.]|nr:hypothetical protein [Archangium sp.]MDP3156382.1 hypothetical protein [Archangium sp.]MDP3573172.1 hypothetical protein [Archangium sp.]